MGLWERPRPPVHPPGQGAAVATFAMSKFYPKGDPQDLLLLIQTVYSDVKERSCLLENNSGKRLGCE